MSKCIYDTNNDGDCHHCVQHGGCKAIGGPFTKEMLCLDIVPYTPEEAAKLGKVLGDLGCPSFGPAVGMELMKVVKGIDGLLKKEGWDESQRTVLRCYRARLMDICAVAVHHQGAIINTLQKLIEKGGDKK